MTSVRDASSAIQMTQRKDRGIVIILVALTVFVIIGLAGLAIDLCRIYITQNELQNFTDSGAIWAVSKLDGTNPGIAAAKIAALAHNGLGKQPQPLGFRHGAGYFRCDYSRILPRTPPGLLSRIPRLRWATVLRVYATQSTIPIYFASIFPGVGFNSIVGAFSHCRPRVPDSFRGRSLPLFAGRPQLRRP